MTAILRFMSCGFSAASAGTVSVKTRTTASSSDSSLLPLCILIFISSSCFLDSYNIARPPAAQLYSFLTV